MFAAMTQPALTCQDFDGRFRRPMALAVRTPAVSTAACSVCAEVSDSISWRRFCRIGLDAKVPHPTTLMKLTSRCGEEPRRPG